MAAKVNWAEAIKPLRKKYKGKKHPLEYKNLYQLVVMVILSAQDSDKHINEVAKKFFEAFPDMESLARADADALFPYIRSVRNFGNKTKWLMTLAQKLKQDKNLPANAKASGGQVGIPTTMDGLTALPGIGRKSASVIMRESGKEPEGVIVDLHVVRVAPRLGIATGTDPKKIEQQIMEVIPQKDWGVGMDISFLGREICRPTNPKCNECPMNKVCLYFKGLSGKK